MGYVSYTCFHLHIVDTEIGHETMPQDQRFQVLNKCKNKYDCLVHEMLFIRAVKAEYHCVIILHLCESWILSLIFTGVFEL